MNQHKSWAKFEIKLIYSLLKNNATVTLKAYIENRI